MRFTTLVKTEDAFGEKWYECSEAEPSGHLPVPVEYVEDYGRYRPVRFSLVGARGHGKTVFLHSLLLQLTRLVERRSWSKFNFTPVPESGMKEVLDNVTDLDRGRLPPATPNVFPVPEIIRFGGMPQFGDFHLLMYDTSGEVLTVPEVRREVGGYLVRSSMVVWLVSLANLTGPEELRQHLANYTSHMRRNGRERHTQGVLVALTKCDKPIYQQQLPSEIRRYFESDDTQLDQNTLAQANQLSSAIEKYMIDGGHNGFVTSLREWFKDVRFCATSALGSDPPDNPEADLDDRDLSIDVVPRGVLLPLLWVLWFSLPRALVREPNGKESPFFDLAEALETATHGSTVQLGRTTYHLTKPLRINSSVDIRVPEDEESEDPVTDYPELDRRAHIKCFGRGGIHFEGDDTEFQMSRVAIEYCGAMPANVCEVKDGHIDFQECDFLGGKVETGRVSVGTGLVLCGKTHGRVLNCRCYNNAANGIAIIDRARPVVENSLFANNSKYGAYIRDAKPKMKDNSFKDNGKGDAFPPKYGQ
jgi:parallel beta-helix repeat protein